MSILTGQMSVTRFEIIRKSRSKISYSSLDECIKPFKARALKLNQVYREDKSGWVCPNLFPEELKYTNENWSISDCKVSDGLVLKIRIDKKKVSSSLLKTMFGDQCIKLERKKNRQLSQDEKKSLLEDLKLDLQSQSLPDIIFLEIFWSMSKNEIFVLTTSKSQLEIFVELFKKTFGKKLEMELEKITPFKDYPVFEEKMRELTI